MFNDEVTISTKAGRGGDGIVSFRREKYVPKGGPNGGDGGNGGNVIFIVDTNTNTLSFFNTRKKFKAEDGQRGKNKKMHGRTGNNLILKLPPGTIIYEIKDNKKIKITDLAKAKEKFIICKGGKGGLGNIHFKSAVNQTPREFTKGTNGERKRIILELRLIADVGIIGLPNAGKSTLLSRISHAKPKVADYPFTTLVPNLGVVKINDFTFVVADIPGLIKGASIGKGLGYKFLRHIKRTKILVHLLECTNVDLIKDYKTIRNELKKFSPSLLKKPEIICVTKVDLISERTRKKLYSKVSKFNPYFISTINGRGINNLLYEIKNKLK